MIAKATQAAKPRAPEGVEQDRLDAVVEATERRMTDEAILHVYGNLEAYKGIAASIARSGMTHHKTEAHVITIAIAAYEMNLGVMEALRGMYLVGGKMAMETWLMDSIATRLGVSKTIHEATTIACRLTLHHPKRPDVETAYSLADAKRAGIIKDFNAETGAVVPQPRREIWQRHPEEMVYWRALSKGLRRIAPDLFGGVYTEDEVGHLRGQHETRATDTNAELDALLNGVEPDPDLIEPEETALIADELDRAITAGVIDSARRGEILDAIEEGRHREAREALDDVRSAVLARMPAQGSLV